MEVGKAAAQWVATSSWILALLWWRKALQMLRGMPRLTDLTQIDKESLPPLPASDGPHLTVLVPACNEEESIEATLRSLLASTGLRLEIIAVNDRSTDRTGERMDAMAAEAVKNGPHTIEVIHNETLPEGWLGKPHALKLGTDLATAPWLLMTDADVTFAPDALERVLRAALWKGADHLAVLPTLTRMGFAEAAMEGTLQSLAGWAVRFWRVEDPKARDFFGVGGFTLVRSNVLKAVGGIERLRMEVVEDVGLGWLVKRAGYRSSITFGPGLVRIHWIRGFFGLVTILEKNGFAGFRFNLGFLAAVCLGLAVDAVVPLAAMATGKWGLAGGLLTYGAIALTFQANRRMNGVSPWTAVLFGPSAAVLAWAFARSAVLTLWRGGVVWRGTLYPIKELRQGCLRWNRWG
jgi:cellulose synthase/poly-beta-1,6-N-acetylglucosamine synthase-like glycosyltransferase